MCRGGGTERFDLLVNGLGKFIVKRLRGLNRQINRSNEMSNKGAKLMVLLNCIGIILIEGLNSEGFT